VSNQLIHRSGFSILQQIHIFPVFVDRQAKILVMQPRRIAATTLADPWLMVVIVS